MKDRIHIRDLKIAAVIGTRPEERDIKQDLLFNIVLHCDLSRAGRTDDIEDTVNYRTVKKKIITHVEKSEYYLIEKVAGAVAGICLDTPGVDKVDVTVDKPGALRYSRSVAVQIVREKNR